MNTFSKTSILTVLLAAIALGLLYWIHAERADKAKAPRTDDAGSPRSDAVTSEGSPESQTVKAPKSGKSILRLQLVDTANLPVAGTPIGQGASGDSEMEPQWRMRNIEGRVLQSDEDGRTVLALDAAAQEKIMLYAKDIQCFAYGMVNNVLNCFWLMVESWNWRHNNSPHLSQSFHIPYVSQMERRLTYEQHQSFSLFESDIPSPDNQILGI